MKRREKNGRNSEVYTQKWQKKDEEKAETEEKRLEARANMQPENIFEAKNARAGKRATL